MMATEAVLEARGVTRIYQMGEVEVSAPGCPRWVSRCPSRGARKGSGGERKGRGGGWQAPPWFRRVFLGLGAVVVVGALVLALRPQPVSVDLAPVTEAEVLSGLEDEDQVVIYPGDQVTDGVGYRVR